MPFHLEIIVQTRVLPRSIAPLLRRLGQDVLDRHGVIGRIDSTLMVMSNGAIRRLNREFRSIDKPTDVLSFPTYATIDQIHREDDRPLYLGDLAISLEKVQRQALNYGHSFEREFAFLFVHGMLHLLGYDHDDAVKETQMFALQEEILAAHGLRRK